jgi:hypothetical protein
MRGGAGFIAPFILTSTDAEVRRGQLHGPAALLAQEPTLFIK